MPKVFQVEATFTRAIQPVQYEKAEASLKIGAMFDENEYRDGLATELLYQVKETVLASLGVNTPAARPAVIPTVEIVALAPATEQKTGEPRKRRTKAEIEAEKAAGSNTSAADALDLGGGTTASATEQKSADPDPLDLTPPAQAQAKPTEITDNVLQEKASAAVTRCGNAVKLKELLKKHGYVRLGEVPADKRVDLVAEIDALQK